MLVRKITLPVLLLVSLITVTSLSCSAVGNLPSLFASATPTATATLTPTLTPTSTPTPTLTPTATPKPSGVELRDAVGGGVRFFDYDGGYIIDLPADWAGVLLKPSDMETAFSQYAESNPNLAKAIQDNQGKLSRAFRMIAFDKLPEHYANGYVANFNVASFQDAGAVSMPMDLVVRAIVDQANLQQPNAKLEVLPTRVNTQATVVGRSSGEISLPLAGGGHIVVSMNQYYFQTKTSLVVVSLYVPKAKADLVALLFERVFNSIRLLRQ